MSFVAAARQEECRAAASRCASCARSGFLDALLLHYSRLTTHDFIDTIRVQNSGQGPTNGSTPSSFLGPGDRQVALRVGKTWLDRERLPEVVHGFVQPALRRERDAEVVVRDGGIRGQLQRGDELGGGLRKLI